MSDDSAEITEEWLQKWETYARYGELDGELALRAIQEIRRMRTIVAGLEDEWELLCDGTPALTRLVYAQKKQIAALEERIHDLEVAAEREASYQREQRELR